MLPCTANVHGADRSAQSDGDVALSEATSATAWQEGLHGEERRIRRRRHQLACCLPGREPGRQRATRFTERSAERMVDAATLDLDAPEHRSVAQLLPATRAQTKPTHIHSAVGG